MAVVLLVRLLIIGEVSSVLVVRWLVSASLLIASEVVPGWPTIRWPAIMSKGISSSVGVATFTMPSIFASAFVSVISATFPCGPATRVIMRSSITSSLVIAIESIRVKKWQLLEVVLPDFSFDNFALKIDPSLISHSHVVLHEGIGVGCLEVEED